MSIATASWLHAPFGEPAWVAVPGVVNMRDVGGLPTRDGRRTAYGRLIRSDNLQDLTDASVTRLVGDLGVVGLGHRRLHRLRVGAGVGGLLVVRGLLVRLLLALAALVKAADYALQRFELTFASGSSFDGAGYTAVNARIPATEFLILISVFVAATRRSCPAMKYGPPKETRSLRASVIE